MRGNRLDRKVMVTRMGIDATVPPGYERSYTDQAGSPGLEDPSLEDSLSPADFSGGGKRPLQVPEGGVDA